MGNRNSKNQSKTKPVRADFKTTLEWCDAMGKWLKEHGPKPTQEEFEAAVKKFEEEREYQENLKRLGIVDMNIVPVR